MVNKRNSAALPHVFNLFKYLEFAPVFGDGTFVLDVVRGEVDGDVAHLDHPPRQGVTERVAAAAAADAVAPVAGVAAVAASNAAERSYGHDDLRAEMLTLAANYRVTIRSGNKVGFT